MGDDFELPEKAESENERIVGLIIAAIAVVLAIVSSFAHETHNDQILAHVDAADQYAFYQAKKVRKEQLTLDSDNLNVLSDRLSPSGQEQAKKLVADHGAEIQRLDSEGKEIQKKGDELMDESKRLARKASVLDLGEIGLQIAVVLCSITIITEQNLFVRMGVSVAAVGFLISLAALLLMH